MTWRAEALMAAAPSERAYLCARGAKAARHVAVPHGFGQVRTWRRLAAQNSRQRIEFWALAGVQPIEYGKEWQVNGCLKFLILGVRLKIRSFGGSFDLGLRFGCRTGPSPLRRCPAFRPRIGRVGLLRRQGLWVCRPCPCVFSARRCFRAACWRMSERPSSFG